MFKQRNTTIGVRVNEDELAKLKKIADNKGVKVSTLAYEIIKKYLKEDL